MAAARPRPVVPPMMTITFPCSQPLSMQILVVGKLQFFVTFRKCRSTGKQFELYLAPEYPDANDAENCCITPVVLFRY
jgi:hypothetical protein